MSDIFALFQNYVLHSALIAWLSAQVLKTLITFLLSGKLQMERMFGAGGMPSASSFPTEELAQISSDLLRSQGTQILQYGTTEGWGPLRESMAEVVAPRGIACKPDSKRPCTD